MSEAVASTIEPDLQAEGRKAATQSRILKAAMELFFARGYAGTSVSQIATGAGVSRASIFWHFGNKQTLFDETCRHFLVPFRTSLERPREHLPPRERVLDQIGDYERFVEENRATIHAFVTWVFTSPDQANTLRKELFALHGSFVRRIERSLIEAHGDAPRAHEQAMQLVSLLHGNMLLVLGGVEDTGPLARPLALRRLVERMLDERTA